MITSYTSANTLSVLYWEKKMQVWLDSCTKWGFSGWAKLNVWATFYLQAQDVRKNRSTIRGLNNKTSYTYFRIIWNKRLNMILYKCIFKCVPVSFYFAGGADMLYNKFNDMSSGLPESPPKNANSDNNTCVVHVAATGYWKVWNCEHKQRVVCQSG